MKETKSKPAVREKTVAENVVVEAGIGAFAINNLHLTIVIFLMVSLLGIVALFKLPKDLLPSANMPAVQIVTFYPGMPVEHVEQDITYLVERYTGMAVGIERQESRSLPGVSIVRDFFSPSTDLSSAISQTIAMSMSVMRKLPPGTQPPLILPFDPMAAIPLALVSVGGDTKTEAELNTLARYWVTNAVQSVPGAMAPVIMGGKLQSAIAYLDQKKLKDFNFSPVHVISLLEKLNTFIPAGDVKMGDFDYQIVSNGMVDQISDLNKYPLRAQNGVTVKFGQVGNAKMDGAIQTNAVLIDSKPEVYVPVYRQPGANSIEVVDQVKKAIHTLESTLSGFKLKVVGDQSVFIRKAIETITDESLIGGGLAALMCLLFLGSGKAMFAVALSLPISMLAACIVFLATGQTMNVMTLGGLALSVGVLVDNAIVVIEVIMHKISHHKMSPREASIVGAAEVSMPVLASTISTLIVFIPIIFLNGIVKTLFSALAIAVISTMVASYFAAMLLIPLFTTHFLKSTDRPKGVLKWILAKIDAITESYGRTLTWTVKRRKMLIPVTFVALAAAAAISIPFIGTELFPKADAGNFQINFRVKTGTRLEKTKEIVKDLESHLHTWIPAKDLKMIISNIGVYYGYPAAYTPNAGVQDAFLLVDLNEDREHTSQYYAKIIREKVPKLYPEAEFGIQLGGLLSSALNGGLVSPIDIQIGGPNYEKALGYAEQIKENIRKIPGAVDLRIQQKFDYPEIQLNIDRSKSMALGVTPEDVVKNVVSAVSNSSSYKQNIWIDPKSGIDYLFGVQFPEKEVGSLEALQEIPIRSESGNSESTHQDRGVPLKSVATIKQIKGPSELNHAQLQPVIDIFLDAQGRDIGGLSREIEKIIRNVKFDNGYWGEIRGEISAMNSAVGSLGAGFLLAAVLVYLVLCVQFRSFLLPAITMTTVPMGLVGVFVMLAVTRTYFSIQAAIGAIFVIGVAVSHGVLLIEYIMEKSHHFPVDVAILQGAKARLRPIAMTSLASILGLLPMALGMGRGSEANIPLGRAVIGGQIMATLLNFYIVPCLFRAAYGWISKNRETTANPL
jgi:multidrug efflux pump subunit AcrB